MKNKNLKIILAILAFAAFIILCAVLYNVLQKQVKPNLLATASDASSVISSSQIEENSGSPTSSVVTTVPADDFTVLNADGENVKLSSLFGKPIVLNFWTSWCPPCKGEMPDFQKLYSEVGNDINFMMVNSTDNKRETVEKGKAFIKKEKFTFPVYYDTTEEASVIYGVTSLPTTIFIDKNGEIVTYAQGAIDEETLRRGIEMIKNNGEEKESEVKMNTEIQEANPNWCDKKAEYEYVTPEDAKRLMAEYEDYTILDVREQDEFDEKHIPNAVLLPLGNIEKEAEKVLSDKREVIFVYCRSGMRSKQAAKKLVAMGYNHVYDFGGIIDWKYETTTK